MNKQKGNSIIGIIAIIAIALMVGIWIGAETDILGYEATEITQTVQNATNVEKKHDDAAMMVDAMEEDTDQKIIPVESDNGIGDGAESLEEIIEKEESQG